MYGFTLSLFTYYVLDTLFVTRTQVGKDKNRPCQKERQ